MLIFLFSCCAGLCVNLTALILKVGWIANALLLDKKMSIWRMEETPITMDAGFKL